MSIKRILSLFVGALVLAGCGGETGQEDPAQLQSAAVGAALSTPAGGASDSPRPQTIGDLFPEGEGRSLVLNNCAACHAVACTAIGQRTQARWDAIEAAHGDRVPGLSESEVNTLFSYLSSNFNAALPEPSVPPAFLAVGCTPQ